MQNLRDTVGEEAEVVQNPIIALGRNRFSESMGPILDSPQATTRALLILRARAARAACVRCVRCECGWRVFGCCAVLVFPVGVYAPLRYHPQPPIRPSRGVRAVDAHVTCVGLGGVFFKGCKFSQCSHSCEGDHLTDTGHTLAKHSAAQRRNLTPSVVVYKF